MIADGYYAVRYGDRVGFYRFHTRTEGRYAGRQFVDRFHAVDFARISNVERAAVERAIASDPSRAAAAFAQDLGLCYVCSRALTDETSRAYGIGPVCANGPGGSWSADQRVRIDAEKIEPPTATTDDADRRERPRASGTLTVSGAKATLVSDYDPAAVAAARAIPGRRWDATRKLNTFPVSSATAPALAALCERFGFAVEGDGLPDVAAIVERQEQNVEASAATDADVSVDGLGGELLPFQRAGVAYAIANGSALIGDEMGLGKTVEALAALEARGAFPALVVVPAVVKLNWVRETTKWLPGRTVVALSGRNGNAEPLGSYDVVVVNYDIVSARLDELKRVPWAAIVADESHYLKNGKAQRTKAVRAIARKTELKLLLTGTPVLNRPIELASQLDVLGRLDEFGGFWTFAKRYCGASHNGYGWDFSGASNLDELHAKLRRTCYVRRTKEQVLTELPAKRRASVPIAVSDRDEYARVERDLRVFIAEKLSHDAEFAATLAGLDPDDASSVATAEIERRARNAERAEVLARINALRQTTARLKLDAARAWIETFLESGKKLVVFAHHHEIVDEIAAAFGADKIRDGVPVEARQAAVDRFQTDPDARVLVCSIGAGGVGITLTAASDVAFVELPWRPGDVDQAEDRCHRIGQHDSVTAWYLLAEDTMDEEMAELLDEKRGVVEAATDGRAVASTSILSGLLGAIARRGDR